MQPQNTVFYSVWKHVPWHVFDRLVRQHRVSHRACPRRQFAAMKRVNIQVLWYKLS